MHRYFCRLKDKQLECLKEITEEEFMLLKSQSDKIIQLAKDMSRIKIVEITFSELLDVYDKIYQGKMVFIQNDLLEIRFTSFLSSFRKFIDNWQTDLTRRYGKDSNEFIAFKQATAKQYDNNIEYRFMYRIRNMDQHCGSIFSKYEQYLDENGKPHRFLYVNGEMLLKNFNEWKEDEVNFIKKQSPEFDIFPIIVKFQDCVLKIQRDIIDYLLNDELRSSCLDILKSVSEFVDEDYVFIASTQNEFESNINNGINFEAVELKVPFCKNILLKHLNVLPGYVIFSNYDEIKKYMHIKNIELNDDDLRKVYKYRSVTIGETKYLVYISRYELVKDKHLLIAVNSGFEKQKQTEIAKTVDSYLKHIFKLYN